MVFSGKDESKHIAHITLECDCGHGAINISQFEDDGMLFIGYMEDGWHNNYHPVRQNIKRFFHNLWEVLSGKEYQHYSILLQGHEIKQLKEAIASLKDVNKPYDY